MMIQKDSLSLFEQDKKYVTDYLKSRNLNCKTLMEIIEKYPFGLLEEAEFSVGKEEYGITHFLSKSEISGYDIRKANAILHTDETDDVAFAVLIGDDVLCCNTGSGEVSVWLVQSGEGEKIHVTDDPDEFLRQFL